MLKIIIPILEKNGIRYMICGGTLLGAVTTGCFIPWDDDVDICVLDEDYDNMIECLNETLPEYMIVQYSVTEKNYYHGWIKIRDRNSKVYPFEKIYRYNGVWIDIYKLTKIRSKDICFKIKKEHYDYLVRRRKVGGITRSEYVKRRNDNKLISGIMKARFSSLLNRDRSYKYIIGSASKIVLDEDWIFPFRTYKFEGLDLYSFFDADKYLMTHYGENYRTLPPNELRRIGINNIDIFT